MTTRTTMPSSTSWLELGSLRSQAFGMAMLVLLATASAGMVLVFGYWALVVPVYVALAVAAILRPAVVTIAVLGMMIAVEPGAIDDFSRPLSLVFYELPPELDQLISITITPMEATIVLAAGTSLFHRAKGGEPRGALPMLVWLALAAVVLGIAYGMIKGATYQIAYHDGRGLIYGCLVFLLGRKLTLHHQRLLLPVLLVSTTFLAVVLLGRYFLITRDGQSAVPLEFAYAHESPIFLAMGFVAAIATVARTDARRKQRLLTILYVVLLVAAMMATGRRAGTLVFLVGGLILAWYLIPRRPLAVILVLIPLLMGGGVYLATYWNHEYGALAQPARAVRSQVDPSGRDASSDQYRDTEKFNVIQTIRDNKVFGVGFGRTFGEYQPLPDLTSFWALQYHTPHQNVLWLWLKMGVFGITAFLALWVIAVKRCVTVLHESTHVVPLALTVVASLAIYLIFSTVDIALMGTRSTAPLALTLALALSMRVPGASATSDVGPAASDRQPSGVPDGTHS